MITVMFATIATIVLLTPLFLSYAAMVQDKTDERIHGKIRGFAGRVS